MIHEAPSDLRITCQKLFKVFTNLLSIFINPIIHLETTNFAIHN